LAEKADLHWTYISGVERGRYNVSLDTLETLASALGRKPFELLK
jgi:transcriptional regulator with XRE-family HTH domain